MLLPNHRRVPFRTHLRGRSVRCCSSSQISPAGDSANNMYLPYHRRVPFRTHLRGRSERCCLVRPRRRLSKRTLRIICIYPTTAECLSGHICGDAPCDVVCSSSQTSPAGDSANNMYLPYHRKVPFRTHLRGRSVGCCLSSQTSLEEDSA
jgi:hypothetical protein